MKFVLLFLQKFKFTALLALSLLLVGCVTLKDPETSQEYTADVVAVVQPGQSVGQSFISRRAGLNGMQLWLQPESNVRDGKLFIELFHNPSDQHPLTTLVLSWDQIAFTQPLSISFPPHKVSPQQSYFIKLSSDKNTIKVLGRNEDAYPYGQLYINDIAQEQDIGFRTSYDYGWMAFAQDFVQTGSQIGLVFPLILALWVPGQLILLFSGLGDKLDIGERIAAAVGLSLASIPVLMTWTSFLGIKLNSISIQVTGALLLALLLWRTRRAWLSWLNKLPIETVEATEEPSQNPERTYLKLALGLLFVSTLAVRLAMVRDQAGPMWVDSVHHATIIRLVVEQGAFPERYIPFINIDSVNYHAGFHSVVAVFHWLSGMEISSALLLVGQVLNALAIFGVYAFTTTLTKNKTAGVAAALISAVFTPMPAYYTSWGRYTHLAGLLILMAAITLNRPLFEDRVGKRWRWIALSAIAAAGILLTHYRVAAFYALLLIAILIMAPLRKAGGGSFLQRLSSRARFVSITALSTIALTLPWWPKIISTLLLPKLGATGGGVPFGDFTWGYLTSAWGKPALIIAGIGILIGLIRRKWFTFAIPLWVALLFLLANLHVFKLPGGTFVNNSSVEISLFIPIAMMAGYALAEVAGAIQLILPLQWYRPFHAALAFTGIILIITGSRAIFPILNPTTSLLRQADWPALEWISEQVPIGETILINPFSWGYGIYAGRDGGFWISPSAGRKMVPPPVIYGTGNDRDEAQRITAVSGRVLELHGQPQALQAFLAQKDIRYVYIGARGGVISPKSLQNSPYFQLLYNKDGAWLFEVMANPDHPEQKTQ